MFDDGTRPYGADIVIDQRRPLRLVIGETTELRVSLVNPVGGGLGLLPGEFLQFDVRTLSSPARGLMTARSATIGGNLQMIAIAAGDTQLLTPQRAAYDLWAIRGGCRVCLIELSELRLSASALGRNYL